MVAPVGGSQFHYAHDFFDVVDDGALTDFATEHFDRDNSADFLPMSPFPAVGKASGYYSSANPDPMVDIANGYPYAYSVAYKDPLGRPMLTSGVGETFKMGGGKEVKSFYVKPTEVELIRIYGVDYVAQEHPLGYQGQSIKQRREWSR